MSIRDAFTTYTAAAGTLGVPEHFYSFNGGNTRHAIRIYARWVNDTLYEREPTPDEVRLIASYLDYYIQAPCWVYPPDAIRGLRRTILGVETASQLFGWLSVCSDLGFRPLGTP